MTRVSAEVRRDEATINDIRDNRKREPFTVVTAADVDPTQVGRTWFRSGSAFGAEYLRRLDIRWINLGQADVEGQEAADRRAGVSQRPVPRMRGVRPTRRDVRPQ